LKQLQRVFENIMDLLSALDPGKQGLKLRPRNIENVGRGLHLSALDPGKQGLKHQSGPGCPHRR